MGLIARWHLQAPISVVTSRLRPAPTPSSKPPGVGSADFLAGTASLASEKEWTVASEGEAGDLAASPLCHLLVLEPRRLQSEDPSKMQSARVQTSAVSHRADQCIAGRLGKDGPLPL